MTNPVDRPGRSLGDLLGHWASARPEDLVRFYRRRPQRLALAARIIGRSRVDAAAFAPEDAVQDAWLRLCEDARDGKLGGVANLEEAARLIAAVIRCRVLDHARRVAAGKRGGPGRGARFDVVPGGAAAGDLDQFPSGAAPPEAFLVSREEVERLLESLGDPGLRLIAVRLEEGASQEQIALDLGVNVRTVERRTAALRALLSALLAERAS